MFCSMCYSCSFLYSSTAYGLRCYNCVTNDPSTCTDIVTCPAGFDRCASLTAAGVTTKTCMPTDLCISPMKCCQGNLCNGAIPTGPSVLLLLLSSAIITFFV
uniref:UPAR/Ly6 domain-containing protein n=1 Tax=Acanthochromis polyacanthus TaxID=80966 RepID=A0A3Q1G6T4_9TELE